MPILLDTNDADWKDFYGFFFEHKWRKMHELTQFSYKKEHKFVIVLKGQLNSTQWLRLGLMARL